MIVKHWYYIYVYLKQFFSIHIKDLISFIYLHKLRNLRIGRIGLERT